MIYRLKPKEFHRVLPLFPGLENHPVINGVIDGNNVGEIYVDDVNAPKTTLIWAKNEMFYLGGNLLNQPFNTALEQYIADVIRPEAIKLGDDDLNLEIYPNHEWDGQIVDIFQHVRLNRGERVPFIFEVEQFSEKETIMPDGYFLKEITPAMISVDKQGILQCEILKFWGSLEDFYEKGIGYTVMSGQDVIGSCISVFVSNTEYEIGINTYQTEHRGKGLGTAMARAFIKECLARGGTPHWTTEDFRKDSIVIAEKVGFKRLENYPVYFLPFEEFVVQ